MEGSLPERGRRGRGGRQKLESEMSRQRSIWGKARMSPHASCSWSIPELPHTKRPSFYQGRLLDFWSLSEGLHHMKWRTSPERQQLLTDAQLGYALYMYNISSPEEGEDFVSLASLSAVLISNPFPVQLALFSPGLPRTLPCQHSPHPPAWLLCPGLCLDWTCRVSPSWTSESGQVPCLPEAGQVVQKQALLVASIPDTASVYI